MNDIQMARDVLAKWRTHEAPIEWTSTIPLVIGTAANPDLLDGIDGMLAYVADIGSRGVRDGATRYAEPIAAAIIAADERMSA